MSEFEMAIKRAHALVDQDHKPVTVYQRHGKTAVLPLQRYHKLKLDGKGAERICTIMRTIAGKIMQK